jgi:hypothetical protein
LAPEGAAAERCRRSIAVLSIVSRNCKNDVLMLSRLPFIVTTLWASFLRLRGTLFETRWLV